MCNKISIEINEKYRESLDLLKQVIPNSKWKEIMEDSEMIESLIDSFMAFIEEQANQENSKGEWGCCGEGSCKSH